MVNFETNTVLTFVIVMPSKGTKSKVNIWPESTISKNDETVKDVEQCDS